MAGQDFRRIGELFYPEVGSGQAGATLAGFIGDAFAAYLQHLPSGGQPRQVRYPAVDGDGSIALTVSLTRGRPDLIAARIAGETDDIAQLLGSLRGTLSATYRGLKLDDVAEPARSTIAASRRGDYAQAGPLGLYFLHGQPIIRQAWLERQSGGIRKPLTLAEARLDAAAHALLGAADSIGVTNMYYPEDKETGELIREDCTIMKPRQGLRQWSYTTQAANGRSLPACSLPLMERLYEQGRSQFGPRSFRRRSFTADNEGTV